VNAERVGILFNENSAYAPPPPPPPAYAQDGAMMRDVILAIRADEAHHRLVNHTFSSMQMNEMNPYKPGQ